jgi:glycosyltransferase involved in cell wall biosynthesis
MTSELLKSDQVTVLLSTYDGEQFLQQQLDSLYEQSYPNIKILVRDDGSSDTTREILKSARLKGCIEQLEEHHHMGIPHSFFALLHQAAQTKTAYIAFCDQDDIWQANKIERAVSLLHPLSDRPALYCSQVEVVTEQLQTIKLSAKARKTGFGNALVENIAMGCTIVLNRKAVDLLCQQTLPDEVCIHDWWCYLVISCFGEVIFDDTALIKYRQHDANAIGTPTSHLELLKQKWRRLLSGRLRTSEQTLLFLKLFADQLPVTERELLEAVCKVKSSYWHRLRLAMSSAIWRQKPEDNIILRCLILINRI